MATHDLGDLIKCQGEFKDGDGNYQDPTAVFFTVTDPDGNDTDYQYGVDPEVTRSSTGVYYVEVSGSATGEWWYRFYSTGTGQAADKVSFYVEDKGVSYAGQMASDRDRVRFFIRDTVKGSGPRPNSEYSNFTDSEINGLLTTEGTWPATVAGCLEALAAEWSQYVDTQVGPRREMYSQAAENYREMAKIWRRRSGAPASGRGARTVFPTPVDAYSDDISTDEV
jgi:hypothetical protein